MTPWRQQKAEARKSWAGSGEAATDTVWFAVADAVGPTEFLGYETENAEGEVLALVKDGADGRALATGEEGFVVLNQTPFYGESGGQVGDTGELTGEGVRGRGHRHHQALGVFAHTVKVEAGRCVKAAGAGAQGRSRSGAAPSAPTIRRRICCTRRCARCSATTWRRSGSLVSPDRLRFDFVHTKPMSEQEIAEVEDIANDIVLQNTPVETRLMGVEDAKHSGARALFGEKYGDEVRVVSMGEPDAAMRSAGRWNCAAARMCGAPATSG